MLTGNLNVGEKYDYLAEKFRRGLSLIHISEPTRH